MTDSPVGLAAWIVEKFRAWSDCGGDVESAISRDRMLADIALYWFTGAIGSSFWPYYARQHGSAILPPGEKISVPTGYAQFPREILKPPRSAAERVFTDIRRWSVMPKGGHFAALEQPELLATEIRAFFRAGAMTVSAMENYRGADDVSGSAGGRRRKCDGIGGRDARLQFLQFRFQKFVSHQQRLDRASQIAVAHRDSLIAGMLVAVILRFQASFGHDGFHSGAGFSISKCSYFVLWESSEFAGSSDDVRLTSG